MACFIVPGAEAVVTTIITKSLERKNHQKEEHTQVDPKLLMEDEIHHIPFTRKLRWLNNMLWGGSALLLFEHIWHGEVVPFPPFLTAMYNPADTVEMLQEMATTGVLMAALVTAAWGGIVAVSNIIEKRDQQEAKNA